MDTLRLIDAETGLAALFAALQNTGGYTVIGPTVRDGAIVYDELDSVADLPAGKTDEQEGGHYRLTDRGDDAVGRAVAEHLRGRVGDAVDVVEHDGEVTALLEWLEEADAAILIDAAASGAEAGT